MAVRPPARREPPTNQRTLPTEIRAHNLASLNQRGLFAAHGVRPSPPLFWTAAAFSEVLGSRRSPSETRNGCDRFWLYGGSNVGRGRIPLRQRRDDQQDFSRLSQWQERRGPRAGRPG